MAKHHKRLSLNERRLPSVNWSRIEHANPNIVEAKDEPMPKRNIFTRHLTGFNQKALDVLLEHGFGTVDEEGFIPVSFLGVSKAVKKKIDYRKASVVQAANGIVVLTGVVAKSHVPEIGRSLGSYDEEPIQQIDMPTALPGYDTTRRLNVALGPQPRNFDCSELQSAIGGEVLTLSRVMAINDQPIIPKHADHEVMDMWRAA